LSLYPRQREEGFRERDFHISEGKKPAPEERKIKVLNGFSKGQRDIIFELWEGGRRMAWEREKLLLLKGKNILKKTKRGRASTR